jgi:asparagine synthase (glutamine-hydrolysing)
MTMPGLWGLIGGPSLDDGDDSLFAAMGERLRHHDSYSSWSHHQAESGLRLGRMALPFGLAADRPAANEDGSTLAALDGEVYDLAEHRRRLESAGHRFRGDDPAEVLLRGYEQEGRDSLRRLDGTFVAAIWDGRRGRLILACDRFGMRPLYYADRPGRLLFASEVKALLADRSMPRTPDASGIAQFFTFGQLLNEETLLEAVKVLPAAGWLTFEPRTGRLEVDRYWRLEPPAPDRSLRWEDWLDRVDDAFGRAVGRRVAGPRRLGLSLSGGLDSRTILAVVDTRETPVTVVSLGMEGSIDVQAAGRMAASKGCPFHRYQLDRSFLEQFHGHLAHMVHLTDGQYLCQCIVMPSLPLYRELGVEALLRGHAGELMHMDKAYSYSLDEETLAIRDEADLERWLFDHLRAFMLGAIDGPLFAPGLQCRVETLARDALRVALAESGGVEPPPQRISHLFVTQRLRRETALSMVEFGSLVETRLPFLDNELIDLLFAAPPEWKCGEAIQEHILRRRMPAFLGIPNANTGARVGAGPLRRSLGRFRLRALAKLGVPGHQPYERLGLWLRQELRPLVEELLLSDRCLDRGLFHPTTLRAVVGQHLNGRRNHTYLLLALMIFEQGQREFLDGGEVIPHSAPAARSHSGLAN